MDAEKYHLPNENQGMFIKMIENGFFMVIFF